MSCSVISSLLFNLSAPQFFHPGKQGLYYLSLLEFRLLLLAENIYASTTCETGVWKTQKIKHKMFLTFVRPTMKNPQLSPAEVPKQVIPQKVSSDFPLNRPLTQE